MTFGAKDCDDAPYPARVGKWIFILALVQTKMHSAKPPRLLGEIPRQVFDPPFQKRRGGACAQDREVDGHAEIVHSKQRQAGLFRFLTNWKGRRAVGASWVCALKKGRS